MSFEVVYTSVRRGLRTGSKGFCTVAATAGIPRALHDKLESLSGYRHTEAAAGSVVPVNQSHLIVRIQRKIYHVVSRIGDAGIDYSGRTNKIAHHLALTSAETERFPDGPVGLLADDGFWYESWSSAPEELPPNRMPEGFNSSPGGFDTWESVFGDAGWAGILGHAAVNGMKPVSIIVPNAGCTMDLLSEALQLVPSDLRWKLCFSTYFSRLAPGTHCHWRFVLDGTGEARRLRTRTLGGIVDCAGSTETLAEDNPFVAAARENRPENVMALKSGSRSQRSGRETTTAGGYSRGTRRSDRRGRQSERRPPTVTAANPFAYHEPEEDDSFESEEADTAVRSGRRPNRIGLWIVLMLSVAVVAILVFFGIQQLS